MKTVYVVMTERCLSTAPDYDWKVTGIDIVGIFSDESAAQFKADSLLDKDDTFATWVEEWVLQD